MKVIIINGSPRESGATGQVLRKISESLRNSNSSLEIEYYNLSKMDVNFCTGCALCYSNGVCPINDSIEKLTHEIEVCDGLILGSPTYASNVSGLFKVLIDRGHFVFEQLLQDKPCFSVVTFENYGGNKALGIINDLIRKSGGSVSCEYLLKLNNGDEVLNTYRSREIETLCGKFLNKLSRKNPLSLFEKITRGIIFHAGIKPHVFKNSSRYEGIINRWIEKGFINEATRSVSER